MHLLEAVAYELEGLTEPLLQRPLELLLDGRAHFLELVRVVDAHLVEAVGHRLAQRLLPLVVGLDELANLARHALEGDTLLLSPVTLRREQAVGEAAHSVVGLLEALGLRRGEPFRVALNGLFELRAPVRCLRAHAGELLGLCLAEFAEARLHGRKPRLERLGLRAEDAAQFLTAGPGFVAQGVRK